MAYIPPDSLIPNACGMITKAWMQLQPLGEAAETGSGTLGSPGPRAKQRPGHHWLQRDGGGLDPQVGDRSAGVVSKVPVPGTDVQRSGVWSSSLAPWLPAYPPSLDTTLASVHSLCIPYPPQGPSYLELVGFNVATSVCVILPPSLQWEQQPMCKDPSIPLSLLPVPFNIPGWVLMFKNITRGWGRGDGLAQSLPCHR